jgi:hypothetical protein
MTKILINTTASPVEIPDTGVTIPADSQYLIVQQDYWLWAASTDAASLIAAGTLVVNDGEYNLPIRAGIGLVQENQVLINEFYTLVQGDDVLIGNGQILYLNDTLEIDVPDEGEVDDVPTES